MSIVGSCLRMISILVALRPESSIRGWAHGGRGVDEGSDQLWMSWTEAGIFNHPHLSMSAIDGVGEGAAGIVGRPPFVLGSVRQAIAVPAMATETNITVVSWRGRIQSPESQGHAGSVPDVTGKAADVRPLDPGTSRFEVH